jgi:hypothetical protein
MVIYNPQFNPPPWVDGVDTVQAAGNNGFNKRFQDIVTEFSNLSQVVFQLNGGLVFLPVGGAGAVSYGGGNVGIGSVFSAANPPIRRLEVNLGANTALSEQVRFGNAVCCNGSAGAALGYAVFCHSSHASDSDYALRQGPNGDVQINAVAGQPITFLQGGSSIGMGISSAGHVVVGSDSDLPPAGTARLQVAGDAFKLTPGNSAWQIPSDARLKEDVRDLEAGLAQLRQVRPVRFRCNGRAGTPAGQEGVGVLGQEIEKIFPEMIKRVPGRLTGEPDLEDLRIYDGSALTYVLVNAVKELAGKVEQLEQALSKTRTQRRPTGQAARRRDAPLTQTRGRSARTGAQNSITGGPS